MYVCILYLSYDIGEEGDAEAERERDQGRVEAPLPLPLITCTAVTTTTTTLFLFSFSKKPPPVLAEPFCNNSVKLIYIYIIIYATNIITIVFHEKIILIFKGHN